MSGRNMKTEFQSDLIADGVFIAANATVRGSVTIGDRSSVWFGAVIRGDTESVEIGCRSNVQDLAVLHADPGYPCQLGDDVTVGHSAVVHGAIVESGALIGIRAVVLNGAKIGVGAIVGAGAVVPEGVEIPAGHLAVGVPAKVIRELTPKDAERLARTAGHYVIAAQAYGEPAEGQ
ncbi:MAG: gamma carbonic anhydrase family protein [Rubripirellula sp.]|jgi:carbonic anhydrase/acetyltransferase-like protein (isoleucine patch superfamily)